MCLGERIKEWSKTMAKANVRNDSEKAEYKPLPADIYLMRVKAADITVSAYKDKDGSDQNQLQLTWEIVSLTQEQEEDGADPDRWVKQWLGLYYGETKKGASKLKAFIDALQAQGLLEEFDPADGEIDSDWFVGITQRVTLDVKGSYNNVVMVAAPRKRAKNTPVAVAPDPKPKKPAAKPAPAPVSAEEDEELFDEDVI